jgi:YHS domain-containing protein
MHESHGYIIYFETTVRLRLCFRLLLKKPNDNLTMKTLFIFITLVFVTGNLCAQKELRSKQYNLERGLAIRGYDPVAYFLLNKAVKGKKELAINVEGATYYFSSTTNKELFSKNFKNYEPQYGGWCAYAMGSNGEKVEVDPETFKIVDEKLYLFYNSFFNNTLTAWNKNEPALKTEADKNWALIFK